MMLTAIGAPSALLTRAGGLRPADPFAFARGAPRAPLRSGGRARGAPRPLCGQQPRIQRSRFEPHNGPIALELIALELIALELIALERADPRTRSCQDRGLRGFLAYGSSMTAKFGHGEVLWTEEVASVTVQVGLSRCVADAFWTGRQEEFRMSRTRGPLRV